MLVAISGLTLLGVFAFFAFSLAIIGALIFLAVALSVALLRFFRVPVGEGFSRGKQTARGSLKDTKSKRDDAIDI